jgi:RND family efflux transporter MFP subunit
MKTVLKILLPLAVLAAAFAVRSWLMSSGPRTEERPIPTQVPEVRILLVRSEPRVLEVHAFGEIQPARRLALAAEVGGRVIEVATELDAGAEFSGGTLLVRVDPTDASQALAAAEAEHARATAALALEEAVAASARADWEALGAGEASPLARREPQLALARAALASADAAVAGARTALDRCTLLAPFAARTVARHVEVGAVIAPGAPLATVQSARDFEVRLMLALEDFGPLGFGLAGPATPVPALLTAAIGGADLTWSAEILRLERGLDPRDRTARAVARVILPPDAPAPLAGTFVAALVQGRSVADVAELPRSALRDGVAVLIVDADSRLRRREIEIVHRFGDSVLVRGLATGERVCVAAPAIVAEGMTVRIAGE